MTFSFLIVTLPHYTPIRICNTVIQFNLIPKELELLHTTEDIDKIHQLLYYITLVPPTTYFTSHNCTKTAAVIGSCLFYSCMASHSAYRRSISSFLA